MALAVLLGTTCALILPARTLEARCTLEEHTHTDSCFEAGTQQLRCPFPVHSHTDDCRDGDGNLICGMADFAVHSHNEFCTDQAGTLVCTLPAVEAHTHSEDCYETAAAQRGELLCTIHEHGEGCYAPSEETAEPVLTCTEPEDHRHEDACYEWIRPEPVQICGKEEVIPHTHSEEAGCYTYENETQLLTCEKTVLPEHNHDESCLSTETADPEALICEIPEHIHSEDCQLPDAEPEALDLEYTADAQKDDLPVVTGDGIRFQLFNYSLDINKTADGSAWRPISQYFTFRNSAFSRGDSPSDTILIPSWNSNPTYDQDGFTANHATVEWQLENGLPVLSLTRNPVPGGPDRTDPGVDAATRSLAYLFSPGDQAVTAYSPSNTILQKSGNHYFYNSESNAVDYDIDANLFRLRGYAERNSTTAGYTKSDGSSYGDFIPFTYTGGQVIGSDDGVDYHVNSADVDYWFGMSMEVDFFQTKDGQIDGGDMVFRFSGDDDVWVFVDDVLVLDLGGTHGTATGSINFSTGQVTQYLSWNGGTPSSTTTSFPTTIRACFDAAGAEPNGGWNAEGTSLADYTEHTLKFFYLERGSAVANCWLDFRLPTLPDKSLTVTKDLVSTGAGEVENFIEDSLSYQFRVVKADGSGELFLKPGTTYTLLSGGSASGTGTVDQNGCFTLKAGQSAQFTDMLIKGGGAVDYIVQEIMPSELIGQYAGVEYEVSGAPGSIETETGTVQEFTTYDTGVLSAEETQTVTYRNQVDISQLGILKLSKQAAPAVEFAEGQTFQMQVKLGGQLLPVGTEYRIGEETKAVTTEGILELQIGQTATLVQGILSGTAYEITELGTSEGGFNASYAGIVTGGGSIRCGADSADGEFGLNSTVHITVTNANYAFAGNIPIYKQALDNTGTAAFRFLVQQAEKQADGSFEIGSSLPGTSITVSGPNEQQGTVTIGYDAGTEGIFYYKIQEQLGTGDFIYDDSFYIAEVTVTADGTASLTGIWKNGTEAADKILFVNRKTTSLLVTKEVTGALYDGAFPFTAAVSLNGEPFPLPQPAADARYSVSGNTISFELAHGEAISIPGIPYHAEVTITETSHEGFSAYHQIEGLHSEKIPGDTVDVTFGDTAQTVRFLNNGGFELPKTGGMGTYGNTLGGLLLTAAPLLSRYRQKRRREGRK